MNTAELNLILRSDGLIARYFAGVFPCDALPTTGVTYPSAFIVNTGDSESGGEHWIALYFQNEHTVDHFDSYGMYPIAPIYEFARNNAKNVYYNKKWLQSLTSPVCGAYVVYFLHFRVRGFTMSDIVQHFRQYNFQQNDALVRDVLLAIVEAE